MFRLKKNKVPTLSPLTLDRDTGTGTVKKNKKKFIDKDEHVQTVTTAVPEENIAKSSTSHINSTKENSRTDEDPTSQKTIEPNINLSRDELLKLLSVFEGELQARDEVIAILKTECAQNPDTRYGLTSQPLKALQRDAATLDLTTQDHVCEQTKEQLKKIIQHQKESYKKLKQMHLASEEKYQRLSTDMEEEKRKHQEYMMKSDDFVNLLEHDRERLKQILGQEKSVQNRKERDSIRKLKENKEELSRLKTLSLELVEERQQQLQVLNEQRQLASTHQQQLEDLQAKVKEAEVVAASEKEHAVQLENELEEQSNKFYKENEEITAKLSAEESKSKQLTDKVRNLGRQMKKLKCVDKNLRKTDDQLWRIKEKLEQEERHEDLLEEVELLRQTVAGMREAEKIYTQAQEECKDLRETLESELTITKSLREELDKLKKSARYRTEMERCVEEANFRFDEIKLLFDAECKKANKMKKQIEEFRAQLVKIDESEATLKMSENTLKQLHAIAQGLKEEKNGLQTKLQLEKDKSAQYKEMLEDERTKVTEVTQKTIEESKQALKLKEQLVSLETKRAEETEALHRKLEASEATVAKMITKEKAAQLEALITNLRKQVAMLKKRLDQLENESDLKENEARLAKEEAEKAKSNLNMSTEKLKRLVALGLNEQIAIAQCEEIKQKHSNLEITNASLRKEVKMLETKLQQKESNTNNNNIALKGIAMSNIATQTACYDIPDKPPKSPPNVRNVTMRRPSPTPRGGASDVKTTSSLRRVSSSSKRDITDVTSSNGLSVVRTTPRTTSQRNSSTSSTSRTSIGQCTDATSSVNNKNGSPLIVRLKGADEHTSNNQPPVSMTITHDPSEEATPTFRIVRDAKTGNPHIETSVTESKKGIQIRMSNKSTDSISTQNRPPPASSVGRPATKNGNTAKITSRVTMTPTNSTRTRSDSKTRKAPSVDRRSSISPTRIPKYRSSTPTPTPSSPKVSRISRTNTPNKSPR